MKTNEAMWKLVNAEDWAAVEKCVADGEWDANQPLTLNLQKGGFLLLSAAAEHGLVSLVKQLIKSGADVNKKLPGEDSPLMSACEAGHGEIVDLLIEAGADVNKNPQSVTKAIPARFPSVGRCRRWQSRNDDQTPEARRRCESQDASRPNGVKLSDIQATKIDRDLIRLLLKAGCLRMDGLHHPVFQRDLEIVELLGSPPSPGCEFGFDCQLGRFPMRRATRRCSWLSSKTRRRWQR
ncbi:MAG: ankyrin repeat domain-containing protein [Verrucomicrobiota bacterium]